MLVNSFIVERVEYRDRRRSTPLDIPSDRVELLAGSTGEEDVSPFACERSGNTSANFSAASIDNGTLVFEKQVILIRLDRLR
jgi:hypothetical protein